MSETDHTLLDTAKRVRRMAHAPYSGYHVGAAVLDEDGRIHAGCNVENASYPEGICAEANAIGSMVAEGGRRIVRIAIVGAAADSQGLEDCTPCGGCRQRILEFADAHTVILLEGEGGRIRQFGIADLLPESFRLK
ncbi:MAG: cytidine deaminase [Rhodothalassiaceae bacterium]